MPWFLSPPRFTRGGDGERRLRGGEGRLGAGEQRLGAGEQRLRPGDGERRLGLAEELERKLLPLWPVPGEAKVFDRPKGPAVDVELNVLSPKPRRK